MQANTDARQTIKKKQIGINVDFSTLNKARPKKQAIILSIIRMQKIIIYVIQGTSIFLNLSISLRLLTISCLDFLAM